MLCAHSNGFIIKRYKKMRKLIKHILRKLIKHILQFFSTAYTHFQKCASFFQNFTHKSKNCTHKMQNASHLLQNEVLHSKITNISKANICKHLWHNINSCKIFVCYKENCVLCFAKSVLWNWKLSRSLRISVWFWCVVQAFECQVSEIVWQVKIYCVSSWKKL